MGKTTKRGAKAAKKTKLGRAVGAEKVAKENLSRAIANASDTKTSRAGISKKTAREEVFSKFGGDAAAHRFVVDKAEVAVKGAVARRRIAKSKQKSKK